MYQYIPLVGAICNSLLTVLVLMHGFRTTVIRVYGLLGISIVFWNLGTFFMFRVTNEHDALFWARFLQFGVIFIPLTLFHLSLLIAKLPVGRYIGLLYAFDILLAASNFSGWFISGVKQVGYGYYSVVGPGFWLFMLYFGLVYVSVFILIMRRRRLPQLHRARLTGLIIAQGTLAFLGMNDILPILSVYYYPGTHFQIYPFGSMAAIFYGLIVGYSVLQHQLLDIHVALSRVSAHLTRFAFLFFTGLTLLLVCTLLAPSQFTVVSFFSDLAVLVISGWIASFYFPRLFGSGSEALERRILGDRFEYHDKVRSFIESMQVYTDTTLLLNDLHELVLNTMGVSRYHIILFDDASRTFSLFRSHPDQPMKQIPELRSDSAIFRFFAKEKNEYLAFDTGYSTSAGTGLEDQAREQLRRFDPEFCFPFFFEDEPFGLLLIGEKTDREAYTLTDMELLVQLTKNLSVIINQIRLKNQIMQAQELELLGRMSRGMAHDLNNLLTPVWTFLQLSNEGAKGDDLYEDLLPVALRNIKTMRAYIREALFFSENLRPDFQLGRLDMVISQAVDLVRAKTEKSVDILVSTPGEVLVEMDEILIQRLVANIVSNAMDASPPGSTIHIELLRLVNTEKNREWVRVRVLDSGEGIRPEDLNRVFTPYFTTKNRGDQERGFGLGLAICRKIVHLHGGNLNIASQIKKGTTVQIDLPNRQVRQAAASVSFT